MGNPYDVTSPRELAPVAYLASESGARSRLVAIIANLDDGRVRATLEAALCAEAGGFTKTRVMGGWRDEAGVSMVEAGTRYEVSFPAEAGKAERLRQLFARAGHDIGERWVHLEFTPVAFEAKHVQVNA